MVRSLRSQGPRIQLTNAVVCIAAVAMAMAIIILNANLKSRYDALLSAETAHNTSVKNAGMLQAGSDNLTLQVQLLAQAGDESCLFAYFEEVDSGRRERAVAGLEVTEEERELISLAKQGSDRLMTMEYHIMKLVAAAQGFEESSLPQQVRNWELTSEELSLSSEDKLLLAQSMVFGPEYRKMKLEIDTGIEKFTAHVLDRQFGMISLYSAQIARHIAVQQILAMLLVLTVVAMGGVIYLQVIVVLKRHVTAIEKDRPLELRGAAELRYLASAYNEMLRRSHVNEEMLQRRADADPLTGIANRGAFESYVNRQIEVGAVTKGAIILVDIDKFKSVNDLHGHDCGDAMLRKLAAMLNEGFRSSDLAGRLGGDEFVVWIGNLPRGDIKHIIKRIEMINDRLNHPGDGLPPATLCAGIALGETDDSFHTLYKKADEALYSAKSLGGGSFVIWGEENAAQ